MAKMGLQFGLEPKAVRKTCLRKHRWMFIITGICGDTSSKGLQSLPPSIASRPSLSFNEIEIKHVVENYFIPGKPDWKPIQLTLFDLVKENSGSRFHPVFEWIKEIYDPFKNSAWNPSADGFITDGGLNRDARLEMYDGCGKLIESWIFENAWPQSVDFGNLDMGSNEIVTCDITLRYARAYIVSSSPTPPFVGPPAPPPFVGPPAPPPFVGPPAPPPFVGPPAPIPDPDLTINLPPILPPSGLV